MTCSGTHLAFPQQSQAGIISVVALNDLGRAPSLLKITGHSGSIEDLDVSNDRHVSSFCPFNPAARQLDVVIYISLVIYQ